jgi:short-subunit dehydrogenase
MQLDYFSVVKVTKSILHHMIANGGGQIATNTSVAGLIPSRNRTAYSSAKFALHGFFDSLRLEVAKHDISITLVAPGRVQTNVGMNALTGTGIAYGKNDRGHDKGLSVEKAAHQIVNAIHRKKRLAIIAKWNDIAWLGVIINKFFPSFYIFLAKRINA